MMLEHGDDLYFPNERHGVSGTTPFWALWVFILLLSLFGCQYPPGGQPIDHAAPPPSAYTQEPGFSRFCATHPHEASCP